MLIILGVNRHQVNVEKHINTIVGKLSLVAKAHKMLNSEALITQCSFIYGYLCLCNLYAEISM